MCHAKKKDKENIDTEIPDGAIPFKLSREGIIVEAKINGISATILLLTQTDNFALDSVFVVSNQNSLKMTIEKKTKKVCRNGRCSVRSINTVKAPTTLTLGSETRKSNEEINIHNLMDISTETKIDMEVPLFKLLKDNILLIDIANNFIKTDITRNTLPHFVEDFTVSKIDINDDIFFILDSSSIFIQKETLSKQGGLFINLDFPRSIIFKENYINSPKNHKPGNVYNSYLYYNKQEKEIIHVDSIVFSNLNMKISDYDIFVHKPERISNILGVLGLDFFSQYCPIIDFNGKNIYLKAHKK
jgi:hypothetical protein